MIQTYRISKDSLGEVRVPTEAYYGPQTQRAVENFPISGYRLPSRFIKAQGWIKAAAAETHLKLGELNEEIAHAIIQAAEEVIAGKWDHQFVVDVYQAGAGTSQNMNANEVIANRALELLGKEKDQKSIIHPNDHVNKSQSTNDTIPTAICMSTYDALTEELLPSVKKLSEALAEKGKAFYEVLKSGRTHLQDAVPIRLGQEFLGYSNTISQMNQAFTQSLDPLLEIGIGGNAVGTGVNTHPNYIDEMILHLQKRTGYAWRKPANRFSFMQNPSAALQVSGLLRNLSIHLIKISSDLRLMNSGPNTGFAEIQLPAVQPGSSIMPGKVNPVMPEMLYMVSSQVIGNDTVVQTAMLGSQLEINVMMPVIAYNLLHSITILSNAIHAFVDKCIVGIIANEEQCRYWMEQSMSMVTLLNPVIGYDRAAELAHQAIESKQSLKTLLLQKEIIKESDWNQLIVQATEER